MAATVPLICQARGLPNPIPEWVFAHPRRWRFDWAWPGRKVALEVQGGIFTEGRHARGAALLKEYEKLNAAAALGWRVLFTTPQQVADGSVGDVLVAVFIAAHEAGLVWTQQQQKEAV